MTSEKEIIGLLLDKKVINLVHKLDPEKFQTRALSFICENPYVMVYLIKMRKLQKLDISSDLVIQLCQLGIFTADKDGFFISEVVEDLIDQICENLGIGLG